MTKDITPSSVAHSRWPASKRQEPESFRRPVKDMVDDKKSDAEYQNTAGYLAATINNATFELTQHFPSGGFSEAVTQNIIMPLQSVAKGGTLQKTVNGVNEPVNADELMAAINRLRDLAITNPVKDKRHVGAKLSEEEEKLMPIETASQKLIKTVDKVSSNPEFLKFLKRKAQGQGAAVGV